MATYTPANTHPFLTEHAAALLADPAVAEAYADAAEALLGIRQAAYDGTDRSLAVGAVALQVNTLVEYVPEAAFMASQGRGARSEQYLQAVPVNPASRAILGSMAEATGQQPGGTYGLARSVRRS